MPDPAVLAARPSGWLHSPGDHAGIAVAARIRLARNLADAAFPRKLPAAKGRQVVERIAEVAVRAMAGTPGELLRTDRLDGTARAVLVERQVISRELAASKRAGALWLAEDERTALMIGEEDHLRLQVFAPGMSLAPLLAQAVEIDRRLERELPWAVHPQLGYLTTCHTNLGTGMRASVMLHLPALAETGELKAVLRALDKLHLAVRGRHGEGSEPHGHLFQISNQRTLGLDEEATIRLVGEAALRVIETERVAREALLTDVHRHRLEDRAWRAWALLTSARVLTSDDLVEHLGWLRLGLALDVLHPLPKRPTWAVLDRIMLQAQPAHLQALHPAAADPAWRDRLRAELVRTWLAGGD